MSIAQNFPALKPALNLDFANVKKLDPRISFSRASVGTYFDANGVLQTASANTARFDHDPVTGESLGLLVEEQRTNLLTYSEQFDNAAWTKTNVTVESDVVVAPDGTLTGDRLVENTAGAARDARRTLSSTAGAYSFGVYAKYAGRVLRLQVLSNSNNDYAIADFDLQAGTASVSYTSPSGVSAVSAKIEEVGNGVFRCSVIATYANTLSLGIIRSVPSVGFALSGIYTGDGYSGIYIWGAQLEASTKATSYIKTEASQVTRAIDNPTPLTAETNGTLLVQAPDGTYTTSDKIVGDSIAIPSAKKIYHYPQTLTAGQIAALTS